MVSDAVPGQESHTFTRQAANHQRGAGFAKRGIQVHLFHIFQCFNVIQA